MRRFSSSSIKLKYNLPLKIAIYRFVMLKILLHHKLKIQVFIDLQYTELYSLKKDVAYLATPSQI